LGGDFAWELVLADHGVPRRDVAAFLIPAYELSMASRVR
jgi:hypothetical protein